MSSQNHMLEEFLSGLIGGLTSVTACAPLDITRTRLNVQMGTKAKKKYRGFIDTLIKIKNEEGLRGYYKGYSVTMISVPLFHSLFFMIYNYCKPIVSSKLNNSSRMVHNMISSIVSGAICDIITNPLWLIRTRIQVQYLHNQKVDQYTGLLNAARIIYKQEGIAAFYKGLVASLLGLSHAAVYFPIYEEIKILSQKLRNADQLNSFDVFCSSIISKLIAGFLTYPHVMLRSRLFDERKNTEHLTRIIKLAKSVYKKEGIKGFYAGLKVDMIKVLPANTITFIVYEYVKQLLLQRQKKE